ncbi:unnamed protein product [Sympodiomycopsis kandeliae]
MCTAQKTQQHTAALATGKHADVLLFQADRTLVKTWFTQDFVPVDLHKKPKKKVQASQVESGRRPKEGCWKCLSQIQRFTPTPAPAPTTTPRCPCSIKFFSGWAGGTVSFIETFWPPSPGGRLSGGACRRRSLS